MPKKRVDAAPSLKECFFLNSLRRNPLAETSTFSKNLPLIILTADSNESFTLINQTLSGDDSSSTTAQLVSAKKKSSETSSVWSSEF